jgi:hypothetical protein
MELDEGAGEGANGSVFDFAICTVDATDAADAADANEVFDKLEIAGDERKGLPIIGMVIESASGLAMGCCHSPVIAAGGQHALRARFIDGLPPSYT